MAGIKAAAVRLFASRGYANTSLEDVATAAGFTKGAVYYYFKSKENLLLSVLHAIEERSIETRAEPSKRETTIASGHPVSGSHDETTNEPGDDDLTPAALIARSSASSSWEDINTHEASPRPPNHTRITRVLSVISQRCVGGAASLETRSQKRERSPKAPFLRVRSRFAASLSWRASSRRESRRKDGASDASQGVPCIRCPSRASLPSRSRR